MMRTIMSLVFCIVMMTLLIGTGWSQNEGSAAQPDPQARQMKCQNRFASLDANNDGTVTREEFLAVGHRRGNAETLFSARDTNADGSLSRDEFCAGRGMGRMDRGGVGSQANQTAPKMKCQNRFASLDANNDGTVTREEFLAVGHRRGNAETLFSARDTNADGSLSRDEFCTGRGMGKRWGKQTSQSRSVAPVEPADPDMSDESEMSDE